MLLSVNKLSKAYNQKYILKNINFTIKKEEIVGLVGENGIGKTSIIKSVLKLIKHDTGNIAFEGKEYNNIFDLENIISYIPDQPIFYEELTCRDNINFIGRIFNEDIKKFDEKSKKLIKNFEFEKYLNKFPHELSKGNKQKLMIILGALQKFKLMIADEPFTGLDPIQVENLKKFFIEMKKEGKSVVISTHLLNVAEDICDRIIIIDNGVVAEEETVANLKIKYDVDTLEQVYLKIKGDTNE